MSIPLPEHPRPDFQRLNWLNLNGDWNFQFDKDNTGLKDAWFNGDDFPLHITVPFGWGSPLSGVSDDADIAWYRKEIEIPEDWKGQRVFLVVGACDWLAQGWLDGVQIGNHEGGYTPFEFELTHLVKWGQKQKLTLRADDTPRTYGLFGKQGYGNVNGIWQTVYLEARPETYLDTVHFIPNIDKQSVTARFTLSEPAKTTMTAAINFKAQDRKGPVSVEIAATQQTAELDIHFEEIKLWDLEHPYLYEVTATLTDGANMDAVNTYFGMRQITVEKMPGTGYPYVALNHKPLYLQFTLDQSYHPEGYYTFPSDEFMKNEILLSKQLGLNGNRVHIKVEIPRKLYWADKLGLLIMADVPNSWGQPTQEMFAASEFTMREMLKRDMNHPCIYSWVLYNETWGLFTDLSDATGKKRAYLPQTQQQVARMYRTAKSLDATRLIEDNSPCNKDHVVTDLFSWHTYAPGYEWQGILENAVKNTYPGSTWNYINGHCQGNAPMFNSECGNVWGYQGSTGDVDWSWDYHMMLNAFRRHPKCSGWLYTEHHDVCNEWNGYVRFDRTPKYTGIEELFPGMSLTDLHADAYLALDTELCRTFRPGETYAVPMYLSLTTDKYAGRHLTVSAKLRYWNAFGKLVEAPVNGTAALDASSWLHAELTPLAVKLPQETACGVICFTVCDGDKAIARNFTCFTVFGEQPENVVTVAPADFSKAEWSQRQWNVNNGLKVNGAGKGFFEYKVTLPKGAKKAVFMAEISSKCLFGKDVEGATGGIDTDFMLGRGTHDPSKNPNSYPMTDDKQWKGAVRIIANGIEVKTVELPDDPADHRGILSWAAQGRDRKLNEAGSYGYLVQVELDAKVMAKCTRNTLTLRLEADGQGLALYGTQFGRYPMDLTFVL